MHPQRQLLLLRRGRGQRRRSPAPPLSLCHRLSFSASTSEPLGVAIVGAGVSGQAAALHLAPLVSAGLLRPVHVYEAGPRPGGVRRRRGAGGTGAEGRSVGVGLWSTALAPFAGTGRASHADLLRRLEEDGSYVGRVGYRTPEGAWLARSELGARVSDADIVAGADVASPSLLFLRERDLLSALREAVRAEEELGTIRVTYGDGTGPGGLERGSAEVTAVTTQGYGGDSAGGSMAGRLRFRDGTTTNLSHPYHLIVSAEGTGSLLRSRYAGRREEGVLRTGTAALADPRGTDLNVGQRRRWEEMGREETNAVDDRGYTVFRGNSPLTDEEAGMGGISFQTWGAGGSMRFAAVTMSVPEDERGRGGGGDEGRTKQQVWFATTSDPAVTRLALSVDGSADTEPDLNERRKVLANHFRSWHDPVARLIESTPADDILVERAMAHRHQSRQPIFDLADAIEKDEGQEQERGGVQVDGPGGLGGERGPILLFVGDASMTVDPVLAQGFTMGMEASADLAAAVAKSCGPSTADAAATPAKPYSERGLVFYPGLLRKELRVRHRHRTDRLLCLLRSTEVVQALAQPSAPLETFLALIIRPAMAIAPDFVKRPVFDFIMKYSLGLVGRREAGRQ